MKKLIFILMLFFTFNVFATKYYVSNKGNDSNSGTSPTMAWKTLTKVNSINPNLNANDQVLFERGGEWYGTLIVGRDSLTFGSYGFGLKPKFYGSSTITNWVKYSGNIYRAKVYYTIKQIFVDDEQIQSARIPKSGYYDVTTKNSTTQFTSTDLASQATNYYVGAEVIGRTSYLTMARQDITASSGNTLTMDSEPSGDFDVGDGFFLVGKLEFLTQAGEWYYDSSVDSVYLWMGNNLNPNGHIITGAYQDRGIYIDNFDYVTIKNIEIKQYVLEGIALLNGCDHVTVDRCNISDVLAAGIYAYSSCSNSKFTNNKINHILHRGIVVNSGANNDIQYNEISYVGYLGMYGEDFTLPSGVGSAIGTGIINGYGGGTVTGDISWNRIDSTGYTGIGVYGGSQYVHHNYITNVLQTLNDGAGIYTNGGGSYPGGNSGLKIYHNIIGNALGSAEGFASNSTLGYGIYLDEGAYQVDVYHNLVYGSSYGFQYHKVGTNKLHNCTSFDNIVGLMDTEEYASNTADSNKYYATNRTGYVLYSGAGSTQRFIDMRVQGAGSTTFDYNEYVVPYTESNMFHPVAGYTDWTGWTTTYSEDANGSYDGTDITANYGENIIYNNSLVPKTFYQNNATNLTNPFLGESVMVSGDTTLNPFTWFVVQGLNTDCIIEWEDTTDPSISAFDIPATASNPIVTINTLTVNDNIGVTGYLINESASTPNLYDTGWSETLPTTYSASGEGSITIYAWVRDAAGNISSSASDNITITYTLYDLGYTTLTTGSTNASRRAMPVVFTEDGYIHSVSMYHDGGSGNVLFGIYDAHGTTAGDGFKYPDARLGVTAATAVSGSSGWQEVNLIEDVFIASGDTVWISYVYETPPTYYFDDDGGGNAGRAASAQTYSSGMPTTFGAATYSSTTQYAIILSYWK